MTLLRVSDMGKNFGGLRAVNNYSLSLEPGEIVGLIGPNGAGKTTIFNLITGIHRPSEGVVSLEGKSLVGRKPYQIAAMGVARTFQEMRLWRHMTVLEHIKMARYSKIGYGLFGALFDTPGRQREERRLDELALETLAMFGVEHLADQLVTNLPYGAARRVEMARAVVIQPKVLLLDEPTVGMTPDELEEMIKVIRGMHRRLGLAIFLIEHRLRVVTELCQRVQTLFFGEVIAEGSPEAVLSDPRVVEAYLGEKEI